MDSIGNNAENKIEQAFEILDIFPKHYGFDMILSIPYGKKFNDILSLIPTIEGTYKANVMANFTPDKTSAYVRVHLLDKDISEKDKLRFNWFKTFYNIEGCVTKLGETLNIDSINEIHSPNKKVVGFRINAKIPVGLSYDKIKSAYETITRTLGKCYLDFNFKNMQLEASIIHSPLDDNEKFTPIEVKPWEIYVAMGHDWNPIILDYSLSANVLIGGMQGTGKTVSLIMGFINLCSQCDDFDLMVCNTGEKQDMRVFKDVKQCRYYANSENEVLSLLRYLVNEMDRRNKLFTKQEHFCFNIYEYNKQVKNEEDKLKVIHLIADEITDLMENDEIQKLLWSLVRKGRSSGIYVSVATQRGSKENLNSEFKGQLGNKICFSQPNTASALTIMSGEDVAKKVMLLEKRRECLVDYTEGIKVAKTLYLDIPMMEELLKLVIIEDDNKLNLDINGNIKEPVQPDETESENNNIIESKDAEQSKESNSDTATKKSKEPRWKAKVIKKGRS